MDPVGMIFKDIARNYKEDNQCSFVKWLKEQAKQEEQKGGEDNGNNN